MDIYHVTMFRSNKVRRLRGDMIELYKILHEKYDRDVSMKLQRASRTSRGHEFKLFQERFRLDIRKFSFRNRVISSWNDLPNTVVTAPSINSFKNQGFLNSKFALSCTCICNE